MKATKPRLASGFETAASMLLKEGETSEKESKLHHGLFDSVLRESTEADSERKPAFGKEKDTAIFSISLTIVGWKYHNDEQDAKPATGASVTLVREPKNEFDPNAVAAFYGNSHNEQKMLGYVSKEQSSMLSPLLDSGDIVSISSINISNVLTHSFWVSVSGIAKSWHAVAGLGKCSRRLARTGNYSKRIAQNDLKVARSAPFTMDQLQALPWAPIRRHSRGSWTAPGLYGMPSPYHDSKNGPTLPENAKITAWPPPDSVLDRLGLASADNAKWWHDAAGLLPPSEWCVSGALDLTPHLPSLSVSHKKRATDTLDGGIHGVTNVWHTETLAKMQSAMEEPNFWCRRSEDALIRAFGGPYVLGQQSDQLKLIRASPHTTLTDRMCLAHNLVYTAVHLETPVAPGFNTLIFGCNLRGTGFHYHQDAIGGLKAKNDPLMDLQPVVTTIFYEHPGTDSGKEIVLWKPLLNFSSAGSGVYDAARGVLTTHGMIHLQKAGLQSKALHGIFHAPGTKSERQGYRVAITARIAKPDADEIVQGFSKRGSYCDEFGPGGAFKLA